MITIGKGNILETYASPEVDVVEVKEQQVICASNQDAGNNGYNSNDYVW